MKKLLFFVTVLVALSCLFSLGISAAEPSSSDEFGEVTIVDALSGRTDFGYSEGDTARVVLKIPGTETYVTYPTYYIVNGINKDNGYQADDDFSSLVTATGIAFDASCVIRIEFPSVFNKFSGNYFAIADMTSIKYMKFGKNMDTLFSFKGNKSLETVVIEDNFDEGASLNITSSAFENCISLKNLDLPVQWTSMGERAFAGCTSLVTIDIGSRVGAIGTAAFLSCTALTTVNIPEDNVIVEVKHRAFDDCAALTGTLNFNKVTTIGTYAFRNTAKNEGCALILKFPSIVTLGGTSGDTHVFSYSPGIKEIYLGAGLKNMSHNTFTNCTGLEKIEMAGVDPSRTTFPSYTFDGCSSLKAFSIPEGITALPQRMFRNCTSLTAVYLPSTLVKIDSGSQDHATFANCTSLYFVSEPFTFTSDADIPAKPDVYYFPEGLEVITGGEVFKKCESLNKTLVFGEKVTSITNAWAFEAGINNPTLENIVFLGDMVDVSTSSNSYWKFTGKIYFANPADCSAADVNFKNLDTRVVFCFGEGNTTHLRELSQSVEATCELPKMVADFCFCGQFIPGTEVTDGVPLGHSYTGAVTYLFTSVTENGQRCTVCTNNCGKDLIEVLAPVYTELGFSANTFDTTKYSVTNGYRIDTVSLKLYEAEKGVTLKLGFGFNAADSFTDGEVTVDSFKLKAEVANQDKGVNFDYHDFVISYTDDRYLDSNIIVGVYVVEKSGDTQSTYFINRNYEDGVNGFESVSYNSIVSK